MIGGRIAQDSIVKKERKPLSSLFKVCQMMGGISSLNNNVFNLRSRMKFESVCVRVACRKGGMP
jgi:hypothetical protein